MGFLHAAGTNCKPCIARRAGKDADSLAIIKNWTPGRTPTLDELRQIGRNSRDGVGNVWGLGEAADYDGSFVQLSRENDAQFYFTHPEVSAKIEALFPGNAVKELRDAAYWQINKSALLDGADSPIGKGMDFLFQGKNQIDTDAINLIYNGATEEEIIAYYNQFLPPGSTPRSALPFPMREVFLLKESGYFPTGIDVAKNVIFSKLP